MVSTSLPLCFVSEACGGHEQGFMYLVVVERLFGMYQWMDGLVGRMEGWKDGPLAGVCSGCLIYHSSEARLGDTRRARCGMLNQIDCRPITDEAKSDRCPSSRDTYHGEPILCGDKVVTQGVYLPGSTLRTTGMGWVLMIND